MFKAAFSDKLAKARKKLEREWRDTRQEMFTALSEYPPDVSEHTFLTRFDDRFGHPTGRTKGFTEPTPTITDETLTADIRHFKAAPADIQADTDWMQAMSVRIPLIAALTEARITELHIKVEGGGENTRIAELDRDTAAAWIPAELQVYCHGEFGSLSKPRLCYRVFDTYVMRCPMRLLASMRIRLTGVRVFKQNSLIKYLGI